jgi:hypothetical protein
VDLSGAEVIQSYFASHIYLSSFFFQASCGNKNTTRRFRDLVVTELVYNLFYLPFI